ncbi:MAG: tyrosine-protein phosphatase [Actinomycetia bacterium]|nr:tyrosine-protein phosphatase [Actinomycetes bacterium]
MTPVSPNIDFDGLVNARDLGGLSVGGGGRVRPGLVYRSETPELMSPADVRRALEDLGITRVVDLRGARFGSSGPIGDEGRGIRIDFFGVAGRPTDEADRSRDGFLPGLLDRAGPVMGPVLEQIVATDGATLVHCHTGKDRTGFVSALLLALLGVVDDDIFADYDRSTPVFDQMMRNLTGAGIGVTADAPPFAQHPPSAAGMRALLTRLRAEWSSTDEYLIANGVAADVLAAVRARMIDSG